MKEPVHKKCRQRGFPGLHQLGNWQHPTEISKGCFSELEKEGRARVPTLLIQARLPMSVPTTPRTDSYQYNGTHTECSLFHRTVAHSVLLTPTQACPFLTGKDGSSVLMPIASSPGTNWLHKGCSLQQGPLTTHHTMLPTARRDHYPDPSGELALGLLCPLASLPTPWTTTCVCPCGQQKNSPQRCPSPNLWNLWTK